MSKKVKNVETNAVTDSQVTVAPNGAIQPQGAVQASAKQAQDKAVQVLSAADLPRKKALEEESAKLEEQAEDSASADSSQVSGSASAQSASEQSEASVSQADEQTESEIEKTAQQIDDSVSGLALAAEDVGMMLAQAGGSTAAPAVGLLGGVNTGAVVAGVVVIGAVAASGGSSSSAPPTTVPTTPPVVTNNVVDAIGLSTSAFILDPSAITVSALSTPSAVSSLTSIGETVTASGTALTAAGLTWGTINSKGNIYTGTSSADLIVITSTVASTAKTAESIADVEIDDAGAGYTAGTYTGIALTGGSGTGAQATVVINVDGEVASVTITAAGKGYETGDILGLGGALLAQGPTTQAAVEVSEIVPFVGTRIDAGGGNDVVRLSLTANVTADESDGTDNTPNNIYLANVEAVQVVASGAARTVDVTNFGSVQELWNWGSGFNVTFDELASASVVAGMYNTAATTSFVYGETITGGSTLTAIASGTSGAATLSVDASAATTGEVTAIRLSSNGSATNTLSVTDAGSTIETLTVVGSRGITLNNITTGMAALETLNASGLSAAFTLNAGNVSAVGYEVIGGSGTNTVNATVNASGALDLTRVTTAALTLTHTTADATVNFSGSEGVGTVSLTGNVAGRDVTLSNLAAGTRISLSATTADDLTLSYAASSDLAVTVAGATTLGGFNTDGARSVSVTTTTSAVALGAVELSDDARLLSLSASGTAGLTATTVDVDGANDFILKATTSSSGDISFTDVTAADDLYVRLAANGLGGNISAGDFVSEGATTTLQIDASLGNVTISDVSSSGRASLTVTAHADYRGGNDVTIGDVLSATGDVVLSLTTEGSTATNANSDIIVDDISASLGSVSIEVTGGDNSSVDIGNIDSDATVHVNAAFARNAEFDLGDVDAVGHVKIGVSMGVDSVPSASDILNITSDTGNIYLALRLDSASGSNSSDLSVGNVVATNGSIYVGALEFLDAAGGNEGIINTGLGVGSTLEIGDLTADAEDQEIVLGDEDYVISLASNSVFNIGDITVDASFVVEHLEFASGSVFTVDSVASEGGITIDLESAASNVTVGFGDIDSRLGVDVDYVANVSEADFSIGNVTSQEGAGSFNISVGRDGIVGLGNIETNGAALLAVSADRGTDVTIGDVDASDAAINLNVHDRTHTVGTVSTSSGTLAFTLTATADADVTVDDIDSEGNVSLTVTGAADSDIDFAGVTSAAGSAIVSVTAATDAALDIGDIEAQSGVTFSASMGIGSSGDVASITAATGDISVTVSAVSTSNSQTTFDIAGGITADQGSIDISGNSSVGSSADVSFGDISAVFDQATLSIGSSTNVLSVAAEGILTLGQVDVHSDIEVFAQTDTGAEVNLGDGGSVASEVGSVSIDIDGQSRSVTVSIADGATLQAFGDISVDIAGGGSSGDVNIGDIDSVAGSVILDIVTGTDGEIVIGDIDADEVGQSTSASLVAGSGSDITVGDITTDDRITLEVSNGRGSTVAIGDLTVNTGEESLASGVYLDLTVNSSSAEQSDVTVGDIDAANGSVVITASLANSATLDLGSVSSDAGTISIGLVSEAVSLGVDSTVTITGDLESELDAEIHLTQLERSEFELTGDITVYNGSLTVASDALVTDTLFSITGDITARDTIDISFAAGSNNDAASAQRFLIDAASTRSLTGNIVADLAVGTAAATANQLEFLGRLEATGTNALVNDNTTISVTASGGAGSNVIIADDDVVSDGDITVDLTLGQGVDGATVHELADGASVISNYGDVELTIRLDSSNSSSDAEAEMSIGNLVSYNGNVTILGSATDPALGTYVGTNGEMTFSETYAGNDIDIGSLAQRVWVLFAGTTDGGQRGATVLDLGDLETNLGDIGVFVELQTGGQLTIGDINAATSVIGAGDVTIDVNAASFVLVDSTNTGASIDIGDIDATGSVEITIVSDSTASRSSADQGSPEVTIGTVSAGAGVTIVYDGYGDPGDLDLTASTITAVSLNVTLTGTSDVTIDAHDISGSVVVDARGLLGGLTYDDSTNSAPTGRIVVGQAEDSVLGGSGNETIQVAALADVVNDTIDGGGGTDTLEILVAGVVNLVAADIDDVDHVVLQGGSTLVIDDGTFDLASVSTSGLGFSSVGSASTISLHSGGGTYDFSNRAGSNISAINGGSGSDSITLGNSATATTTVVTGGAGVDSVSAGTGNWNINGGASADTIVVGAGTSTISGESGANSINAGAGNHTISAGTDADTVTVGTGSSNISLSSGNSSVTAGAGSQTVTVSDGADTLALDAGNHVVTLGEGATNSISGGAGNSSVSSLAGADSITLGAGSHTISSGNGASSVSLGAGDSRITGGSGSDVISVGAGSITVSSGDGVDSVALGAGNSTVNSGTGSDTVTIGNGNSSVAADTGSNSVSLGAGNSTVTSSTGADSITLGAGNSSVSADSGANTVSVGAGNSTITTGGDADSVTVGSGNSTVTSGGGNDSVNVGAGNSSITAGEGNDTVDASAGGNMVISTGTGNNSVEAGAGTSTITGGSGNDTIDAGDGIDSIVSGGGADDFILTGTFAGRDLISGYTLDDSLDLSAYATAPGAVTYEEIASDTADITTDATVIVIGGVSDIATAAALIAADTSVTGTGGVIVFSDGTDTFVYGTTNLGTNGTETLLATLTGVSNPASVFEAASFIV
jgi:Ca2+-binding RTX toxin-like protein